MFDPIGYARVAPRKRYGAGSRVEQGNEILVSAVQRRIERTGSSVGRAMD